MQSYVLYCRNIIRAKEIADALRRLQDKTKFKAAIRQYINDKQWSANVKTSEAALRLLETAHEDKFTQKKVIVMPVRNTLKLEEKLRKQIKDQHWPLIAVKTDRVKGRGVFALKNITKKTIVCDYHGDIISKEDGTFRYEQLYKHRPDNVYMLNFQYSGKQYYCDAVKDCDCHPTKTIKGRCMNHSRKSPNVTVRPRADGDTLVLLIETIKDIEHGDELLWNYGCHSDPKSHQLE